MGPAGQRYHLQPSVRRGDEAAAEAALAPAALERLLELAAGGMITPSSYGAINA